MDERIITKPSTDAYREGWEQIWGKDEPETVEETEEEDTDDRREM